MTTVIKSRTRSLRDISIDARKSRTAVTVTLTPAQKRRVVSQARKAGAVSLNSFLRARLLGTA